jgi:hypothetical protein
MPWSRSKFQHAGKVARPRPVRCQDVLALRERPPP